MESTVDHGLQSNLILRIDDRKHSKSSFTRIVAAFHAKLIDVWTRRPTNGLLRWDDAFWKFESNVLNAWTTLATSLDSINNDVQSKSKSKSNESYGRCLLWSTSLIPITSSVNDGSRRRNDDSRSTSTIAICSC
jgi:hypothetical protein